METNSHSLSVRLTGAIVRRPVVSLLIGVVGLVVMFGGFGRLKANFTHTGFFHDDDPALQRFNAFERRFGNDDAVAVVVHSPSGVFDMDSAQLLQTLTTRMWKVPEVIRVDSLANFQWVHASGDDIIVEPLLPDDRPLTPELLSERGRIALAHETIPDYLVSRDGKTALVYARIKPGIDHPPDAKAIVAETRKVIADVLAGDHEIHLTGGPVVNDAFRESSEHDSSRLIPALLLMVALFLVFTFRRAGGVVLPFVVIFVTTGATVALAGWLGVELTAVTFTIPQVMIAVCVADSVHVLSTFYHGRRKGLSRQDAARHALYKNFVPTLLTSITTAAGFLSFATAGLKPVSGFGLLAGGGTLLAWLLTYLIMGALMVLWPGREPAVPAAAEVKDVLMQSTPRSRAFIAFIRRWRLAVLGGFAVVCAIAGLLTVRNTVNSDPYKYFQRGNPLREAQDFILEHLNGVAGYEAVVLAGVEDGVKDPAFLRKVEAFETEAAKLPGITKTVSLVDIIRQTNRSLHGDDPAHYRLPDERDAIAQELFLYTMSLPQGMDVNDRVTVANDALRVTFISSITDSTTAVATAERLEALAKSVGLDAHMTGKNMLYQSMNGHVVNSFLQSLAIALALIGMIMLATFRSLKLGLLAMIPNVIPLVLGGALLWLLGHPLDIGTVMVASIGLGIAVDNTIHIMANYVRHVRQGDDPEEALSRLVAHTGPAMIVTTLILVVGFSTLAFGTFMPNVFFGILTASILAVGLVTDLLLLPALLLSLPAARRHAREPVGGEPELAA